MEIKELTVWQRLINAKKEFKPIIKDTQGYGYNYAKIDAVLDAVEIPMWNNDLIPFTELINNVLIAGFIDARNGDKYVGYEQELIPVALAKATEIQSYGASITYLRRYGLCVALGLVTEDDNGASASNVLKPRVEQEPVAKIEQKAPTQPTKATEPTQDDLDAINFVKTMIDNCTSLANCNDLIENPIMTKWAKWNDNELAYYWKNKAEKLNGVYDKTTKQYIEKV